MKKLQLLALLVLSLSIFACSDDEGNNNQNAGDLIGAWLVTSATCDNGETITSSGGAEIARVEFTYFWDNIDGAMLDFSSNNTLISSGNYTQVLTTTTFAQGMNFGTETTETDLDYSSTGTWSLSGNTVTVTSTGGQVNGEAAAGNTGEFDIISINETTMELRLDVVFSQSQSGVDINNTQTLNMMLTKM